MAMAMGWSIVQWMKRGRLLVGNAAWGRRRVCFTPMVGICERKRSSITVMVDPNVITR